MKVELEELYQVYKEFGLDHGVYQELAAASGFHPSVIQHYNECRDKGTSVNLSEMFALRVTPQINGTDAQFWTGWEGDQFGSTKGCGRMLDKKYREQAIKQGISMTGKRYMHSLADYPGDPTAWVSDTHDVKRILKEKNLNSTGVVTNKAEARDPQDAYQPVIN